MNEDEEIIIEDEEEVIEENPGKELKSKIFAVLFLIWFVGSMAGMLVLSSINGYYTMMIFGQYFLVFSIFPLLQKGKDKLVGIPFLLVGLACIIIPFFMMHPELLSVEINWESVIIVLFLLAFVLAGLGLVFVPIISRKKKQEVCIEAVDAVIVDYDYTYSDGKKLYCPIYEYEFYGKKYTVNNNHYTNIGIKEIGTTVNLMINPDNPEEFMDSEVSLIIPIGIGIVFLATSVPILIMVLNNISFIK